MDTEGVVIMFIFQIVKIVKNAYQLELILIIFLQKSHRRLLKRNKDLTSRLLPLHFDQEHFQLYQSYQNIKHPNGGMNFKNNKLYCQYLLETNVESKLLEFRKDNELKIVCIFDIGENSLSCLYLLRPFRK